MGEQQRSKSKKTHKLWDENFYSTQAKQVFIGDFFEDLAAKVLKCKRLAISSEIESCADLKDDRVYYEVKGAQTRAHGFRLTCCQILSYVDSMKMQPIHVRYAMFAHSIKNFSNLNTERAVATALAESVMYGIVVDVQFLVKLIDFTDKRQDDSMVRAYHHPVWKTWEHYICLLRRTVEALVTRATYKDALKNLAMNPEDFKWVRRRCRGVVNQRRLVVDFPLTQVLYRKPEPFEYAEEEIPF